MRFLRFKLTVPQRKTRSPTWRTRAPPVSRFGSHEVFSLDNMSSKASPLAQVSPWMVYGPPRGTFAGILTKKIFHDPIIWTTPLRTMVLRDKPPRDSVGPSFHPSSASGSYYTPGSSSESGSVEFSSTDGVSENGESISSSVSSSEDGRGSCEYQPSSCSEGEMREWITSTPSEDGSDSCDYQPSSWSKEETREWKTSFRKRTRSPDDVKQEGPSKRSRLS